jgi:predicted metalloprotease with PDZ domain
VRGRIRVFRESDGQRELRRRRTFAEVVALIERIKGEGWDAFRDRYGDWGRDLALWAGRQYGGLTLRELGAEVGGLDYSAVAMSIRRLDVRARRDKSLRSAMRHLAKECAK